MCVNSSPRLLLPVAVVSVLFVRVRGEDEPSTCSCSCTGTGAISVVVTLVVVAALQAAAYLLWKAYWKGKTGQHLVLVSDPEKGDSIYAFDNPGFKEGPILQAEEKENQKVKWAHWSSVTANNTKLKSMDDSFTAPRVKVVPLRSQDFTGLGFNVCGNMRDGIFVKDLLHRGPASESGSILPGDRIESVKISVRHMVLEDALTILSYASPYEVELALEEAHPPLTPHHNHNHSHGQHNHSHPRICHPFYRSRSISDLTTIGKSSTTGRRAGGGGGSGVEHHVGEEVSVERDREGEQNTKNKLIEGNHDEVGQSHGATGQHNQVKSLLAKGIQNLRERLHPPSTPHQEWAAETLPEEVTRAASAAKNNRRSLDTSRIQTLESPTVLLISQEVTEEREDPVAAKRNKRKAPVPPQTALEEDLVDGPLEDRPEDEEEDEEDEGVAGGDSDTDSEPGECTTTTTIELDASHITVHQPAEPEQTAPHRGRKTCSLGDLSRYEDSGGGGGIGLERAASLDLEDGGGGGGGSSARKRKAPPPPPPTATTPGGGSSPGLRPASVWGTLEDAVPRRRPTTTTAASDSDEGSGSWEEDTSHRSYVTEIRLSGSRASTPSTPPPSPPASPQPDKNGLVKPPRAPPPSRIPVRAPQNNPSSP